MMELTFKTTTGKTVTLTPDEARELLVALCKVFDPEVKTVAATPTWVPAVGISPYEYKRWQSDPLGQRHDAEQGANMWGVNLADQKKIRMNFGLAEPADPLGRLSDGN